MHSMRGRRFNSRRPLTLELVRPPAGDPQKETETVFPCRVGDLRVAAQSFPVVGVGVGRAAAGDPQTGTEIVFSFRFGVPGGPPNLFQLRGMLVSGPPRTSKMERKLCFRAVLGVADGPGVRGGTNTYSLQHVRYAFSIPADEQSRRAGSALFRVLGWVCSASRLA